MIPRASERSLRAGAGGRGDVRWALLLLLGSVAVLYWWTLYPGVGGRGNPGDSAKFQYIGHILGVPHQPGYPQYLILNHLWTRLPIPLALAEKVNLLSAMFSLAAGAFLFLFIRRLCGSRAVAALATATVLLGRVVWTFSTEAEVYSLNLLYLCAVFWAADHWRRTREWKWLAVLIAVYGLSFGNHPLMITLLPGLAVLLLATDLRALLRLRTLAFAAVILALTVSQYGLLVWRANSGVEVVEGIPRGAGIEDLSRTLRAKRFTDEYMLGHGWETFFWRWGETAAEATEQLAIVGLVLSILGFRFLLRRRSVRGWFLLLSAAGTALFACFYQIGDWQLYLAPVFVALTAAAAVGATRALATERDRRIAQFAWLAGVIVMAAGNASVLRETENPWDRSLEIEASDSGARVVTYAAAGYVSTQMNRYYRLGLGLEAERDLDLVAAEHLFERSHAYLEDRDTVFRHPRVKELFDRYRVDYTERFILGDPENRYVFQTGVRHPVRQLVLVPSEDGLRVETVDGKLLAEPVKGGRMIVIGTRERRVKGVAPLYVAPSDAVPSPMVGPKLLGRVLPHDWVAVLFEGAALEGKDRRAVAATARFFGIAQERLPVRATALVLAGPATGGPDRSRLIVDPVVPVRIEVFAGGRQ